MDAVKFSIERRRFLGGISLSFAGVAAGSMVPVSLLKAAPQCAVLAIGATDPCGDWQLDDICLAYPPYAFRTGAMPAHTRPAALDACGADWHWVS
jgi:hypothetical protein